MERNKPSEKQIQDTQPISKKEPLPRSEPSLSQGSLNRDNETVLFLSKAEVQYPQPQMKKTSRMLLVEEKFGEPIEDLLRRLYEDEHRSISQMAQILDMEIRTTHSWLIKANVSVRTIKEASQIVWAERKDEIIAKMHTSESAIKRSESHKKRLTEDPGELEKIRASVKQAHEAHIQKAHLRREFAFGKDVAQTLFDMHQNQGLTAEDIAKGTPYSPDRIINMMRTYNIPYTERSFAVSVLKFQEVHQRLWSNPQAVQVLRDREKEVISKRFFTDGPIPSLDNIAQEMGVTRERVRQIESSAIEKIRTNS